MKIWNKWVKIWNGTDKRNIQNKATNKTNLYLYKTYIDTLKYRNGSINKIVMCVYVRVCVCVTNTTTTTERLNVKSVLIMLKSYFKMLVSSYDSKQAVFPRQS